MSYNDKASQVMLQKAEQKMMSANDDLDKGRYDSCISNLYYSAFQTITAYLILKNNYINKHTHVRGFVNKELANKGVISKDLAKIYNKLMDYRSDADYNSDIFFDEEKAKEMLEGVKNLNIEIKRLIDKEREA